MMPTISPSTAQPSYRLAHDRPVTRDQVATARPAREYEIYRNGTLHSRMRGTRAQVCNLIQSLLNKHSACDWDFELA